jgi:hypothetical protein
MSSKPKTIKAANLRIEHKLAVSIKTIKTKLNKFKTDLLKR